MKKTLIALGLLASLAFAAAGVAQTISNGLGLPLPTFVPFVCATSACPALKRNGNAIDVRMGDDSGLANINANAISLNSYIAPGVLLVSGLSACNSGTRGARETVQDGTQAFTAANFGTTVTGGGSNILPVTCDGVGNWKIG